MSGDETGAGGAAQGGAEAAPWGGKRPWWSAESGGTGPLPSLGGTGGHPMVGGSGAFPRVGTGGQRVVGTGGHPAVGTGGHPVVGTGGHPVVRDGTGPLPPLPAAPAPARRRRVPRLLLVGGAAAVAAVALMAGALAFRTGGGDAQDTPTAALPASTKVITAGAAAGGLHRDALTAPKASAAYPFIAGAVEAGGVPAAKQGTAVYTAEPVRKLNVLFMGGTGAVGDPAAFLRKARPTTFIQGQDTAPGGKGAKAFCGTFAVLAETHTYCAWATRDSYGIVAANRATVHPQFPLMTDVMRRIRKDVERPK
ncbi:hypothetical protein HUT06_31585 [Actinomadura sp. NAK00032]|uniref:hypothetical protein n=1 Tax=Actinomadura sp. NAK00032 TaxID=2742128 RepID=UPI0015917445|nr:hypothetical protein [Actinomadura sp. NAK00032]QKW37986.1 hypothetical protein HUT06_31585 [Actinomadura sp. NAK00032]